MTVDELTVKLHRLQAQGLGTAQVAVNIPEAGINAVVERVGNFSTTSGHTVVLIGAEPALV